MNFSKYFLTLLFAFGCSLPLMAQISNQQTICALFSYDDAGNRIRRYCYTGPPTARLAQSEIKLSPNPTTGIVEISLPLEDGMEAFLEILDLNGRIIQEQKVETAKAKLDISTHPQGIYLLRMRLNNEVQLFKVLKQ